jgi:hypothetical protein
VRFWLCLALFGIVVAVGCIAALLRTFGGNRTPPSRVV